MDFTIQQYRALLSVMKRQGFRFLPVKEFLGSDLSKVITLRHDVDRLPQNSLRFARIQHEQGIRGTYYFRAVPESWDVSVIREIAALNHEIGYHYENLTTCHGDVIKGIADFEENLNKLRQLVPVSTICMHGSPRSPYDSKDLWKAVDYRTYGIVGEPYFDTDFNKMFYLTDTGRMWDGYSVSVRDKIVGHQERWNAEGVTFHTTQDIIRAAEEGRLPDKIMMTFHPQRWHAGFMPWARELMVQSAKNVVKRGIVYFKK